MRTLPRNRNFKFGAILFYPASQCASDTSLAGRCLPSAPCFSSRPPLQRTTAVRITRPAPIDREVLTRTAPVRIIPPAPIGPGVRTAVESAARMGRGAIARTAAVESMEVPTRTAESIAAPRLKTSSYGNTRALRVRLMGVRGTSSITSNRWPVVVRTPPPTCSGRLQPMEKQKTNGSETVAGSCFTLCLRRAASTIESRIAA
jgi:hypothetical protein